MDNDNLKATEKQVFIEGATQIAASRLCLLIVVGPNDPMKSKVQNILDSIQRGPVLVAGRATGIPKLIAVVEVAKQKLQESGSKVYQYNKSDKQISRINPSKKTIVLDDKAAVLSAATLAIRGDKTYTLPILYIHLGLKDGPGEVSNSGWTEQTT